MIHCSCILSPLDVSHPVSQALICTRIRRSKTQILACSDGIHRAYFVKEVGYNVTHNQ